MNDQRLTFLLADIGRLMRRRFVQRMPDFPLPLTQARALTYLARNEGTRQVEMAEALEIKPITLTRVLDQLVDAGLIERRRSETDRRAFQLYLTPTATPYLQAIESTSQALSSELLALLPQEQADLLLDALHHLRNHLAE